MLELKERIVAFPHGHGIYRTLESAMSGKANEIDVSATVHRLTNFS
jgi:hypothetical protein